MFWLWEDGATGGRESAIYIMNSDSRQRNKSFQRIEWMIGDDRQEEMAIKTCLD